MNTSPSTATALRKTPLHDLHRELGARMVPFAGYEMPVQYPAGLIAEHRHTRAAAGLFDVSHMGQISISGAGAGAALEAVMPVDAIGLATGRQRYGMLLDDNGGILDDLMFTQRGDDYLLVVNGACKEQDLQWLRSRIGERCVMTPLPDQALLALQGPMAAQVLQRLAPESAALTFMTGASLRLLDTPCFVTRSGYTGEDGFEISVPAQRAEALARVLLAEPEVAPIGLGARNSLRLEAGLCLHGNDIGPDTTPVEAALTWAIQKVRREGGARAGGFAGASTVLAQLRDGPRRLRVGLIALERIPVREPAALQTEDGQPVGSVTSGLLGPTIDQPIAMGYVAPGVAALGTRLHAVVRGKPVPMQVSALPFVPHRYFRGPV